MATWIQRLFLKNVGVTLRCGETIRADLHHPEWRKLAKRGYQELDTERFLSQYLLPGDVVMDIGAHIGMLTSVAAKRVAPSGKVYAFEVDAANFRELDHTIRRNRVRNVYPEKLALGEREGVSEFVKPQEAWGSFMVNPDPEPPPMSAVEAYFGRRTRKWPSFSAQTTTIEGYVRRKGIHRIDLIKIDVDGPELSILRGMGKVLHWKSPPALVVETSLFNQAFGISFADLFDFLVAHGYQIFAAVRMDESVVRITSLSDIPITSSVSADVDLFCCIPSVHGARWPRLWFSPAL